MSGLTDGTKRKFAEAGERISNYTQAYKAYWPALFFLGGFIFDVFTLGQIDNIFNILTHVLDLLLTLAILLTQIMELKVNHGAWKLTLWFYAYQNEAVHFLLGALLSAFVIFFFKSGTLINTALLLAILSVLLVVNELSYFRSRGPTFKMVLFNISLCCFFIYLLPVLFGRISSGIFLLSMGLALMVMLALWYFLMRLGVEFDRLRRVLLLPTTCVVLGFILLYGARMIPPVPLSLKQIGIYHDLKREAGKFHLYKETAPWRFWSQGDTDFKARDGDRLYLFCRIFAPGGFRDQLFFHFQYLDKQKGWQTSDRIPLTIVGGRNEGFRGYAYKENYHEGRWRALVETSENLEIGRINYRIEKSATTEERTLYQESY